MTIGLLISAGKQTRFKSEMPKALSVFNGRTLLDVNMSHLSNCCDKAFVVCNHDNEKYFDKYETITIESGLGCGDAVMKALEKLDLDNDDRVFIQWGDTLHKSSIYKLLSEEYVNNKVIIPCVVEMKPYVQVMTDDNGTKVLFSKYGEETSNGYHDLSLFYGNAKYMLEHMREFADKFKTTTGYKHKHGNEMQFLDVFNDTDMMAKIVDMKDYKDFAFNTIEELENKTKLFQN